MARASQEHQRMFEPTVRSLSVIYHLLLGGAAPWVLLALVMAVWFSNRRDSVRSCLSELPAYESVAVIG
jgi:hypothetical protein